MPDDSVSSNRLTGTVPAALGKLTALTFLDLGGNKLTGTVPAALGKLTALKELSLRFNGLTGAVPAALGQLTALTSLGGAVQADNIKTRVEARLVSALETKM
jgi:Leucine-rich repeat (LRR) protein